MRRQNRSVPSAAAAVPSSAALKKLEMALTLITREPKRAMAIADLAVGENPVNTMSKVPDEDFHTGENDALGDCEQTGNKIRCIKALW